MQSDRIEPPNDSRGDGPPPMCEVALCGRPANYRTTDRNGEPTYLCEGHRPFADLLGRLP